MKKKQLEDNKGSVVQLKKRLRSIEGSNDTLAVLEEKQKKYVAKIEAIESTGVLEKCQTDIKTLSRELKDLENDMTEASENVDVLSKDKSKLDQIAIFNQQKIQNQTECSEM